MHGPGREIIDTAEAKEEKAVKPNLNIQINEDQQRSISTALALLNEVLCLFEDYARGREIRSIFYEERNRLTERQRKKMLIEIERMHALMRRIKTELDLPLKIKDVQNEIWGRSRLLRPATI
ncbi:MAG: hypothetical protein NTU85_03665 [Candidatus Kaiserbacteria bacterium]|nr:hypothetical protein [Candidatus Kaiserbacteria bacterium]